MASLRLGTELSLAFSLLCHCHFLKWIQAAGFLLFPSGLQGRETGDREEEPKNCLQDFPSVSDHTVPLTPILAPCWEKEQFFGKTDGVCVCTHTHTHTYIECDLKWFKEEGKLGRKHVLWTKAKIRLENSKRKQKSVSASGSWFIKDFWG